MKKDPTGFNKLMWLLVGGLFVIISIVFALFVLLLQVVIKYGLIILLCAILFYIIYKVKNLKW